MSGPSVGLIVVAAGSGTRLGAAVPKAFVDLGGCTLLEHALRRLTRAATSVVVVAPSSHLDRGRRITASICPRGTVVAGGTTRTDSVSAGLAALPATDIVAVHDAARPLVDEATLRRAVDAVLEGADAAAPATHVTDTLKQVTDEEVVIATVDRAPLRAVQTPQVFRRGVLIGAHDRATGSATDDLALVEALGGRVVLVPGSPRHLKITVPDDLLIARALLDETSPMRLNTESTCW